jgi:hypothetical protein
LSASLTKLADWSGESSCDRAISWRASCAGTYVRLGNASFREDRCACAHYASATRLLRARAPSALTAWPPRWWQYERSGRRRTHASSGRAGVSRGGAWLDCSGGGSGRGCERGPSSRATAALGGGAPGVLSRTRAGRGRHGSRVCWLVTAVMLWRAKWRRCNNSRAEQLWRFDSRQCRHGGDVRRRARGREPQPPRLRRICLDGGIGPRTEDSAETASPAALGCMSTAAEAARGKVLFDELSLGVATASASEHRLMRMTRGS